MTNITTPSLIDIAKATRLAASQLAVLSTEAKNQAIEAVAQALTSASEEIVAANLQDCQLALADDTPKPLFERLKMDSAKLASSIAGVRDVGKLPDPVGITQIHRELDQGLILKRITSPLGVLGVIFEARPEAAIQISALAIKSGNGVILKGGKEALNSCTAIVKAIRQGLAQTQVSSDVVQLLTSREETLALLNLHEYVDLIIPRGSNSFVRFVQQNTMIPVLGHAEGICHLYVDKDAALDKALAIAVDAKVQYPAACNAIETLLVHIDIAPQFFKALTPVMERYNVELRGCDRTRAILPKIKAATAEDWVTEYSDLILAIKIVDNLADAIKHINTYGSRHTEAIITENQQAANIFLGKVDAAGVFHNCSTRFADGFRYGFGAEVGISTQQMPPRGPVGLEGIVTYKYQLVGKGHIVANYTGDQAASFTHIDL
jgi:glutamate-5-semialdehyde dehydrogenase